MRHNSCWRRRTGSRSGIFSSAKSLRTLGGTWDGTWPTLAVRTALERHDRDDMRRGFADGIYNKRGVTMRGLTDGGKQEYELADSFDGWAALLSDKWPRTAAVLRAVAEDYRAQGQREDNAHGSLSREWTRKWRSPTPSTCWIGCSCQICYPRRRVLI